MKKLFIPFLITIIISVQQIYPMDRNTDQKFAPGVITRNIASGRIRNIDGDIEIRTNITIDGQPGILRTVQHRDGTESDQKYLISNPPPYIIAIDEKFAQEDKARDDEFAKRDKIRKEEFAKRKKEQEIDDRRRNEQFAEHVRVREQNLKQSEAARTQKLNQQQKEKEDLTKARAMFCNTTSTTLSKEREDLARAQEMFCNTNTISAIATPLTRRLVPVEIYGNVDLNDGRTCDQLKKYIANRDLDNPQETINSDGSTTLRYPHNITCKIYADGSMKIKYLQGPSIAWDASKNKTKIVGLDFNELT